MPKSSSDMPKNSHGEIQSCLEIVLKRLYERKAQLERLIRSVERGQVSCLPRSVRATAAIAVRSKRG